MFAICRQLNAAVASERNAFMNEAATAADAVIVMNDYINARAMDSPTTFNHDNL